MAAGVALHLGVTGGVRRLFHCLRDSARSSGDTVRFPLMVPPNSQMVTGGPHGQPTIGGAVADGMSADPAGSAVLTFNPEVMSRVDVAAARQQFSHAGYLALPGLLRGQPLAVLRVEMERLLARARRRDFDMACMGGSPRHMTTLGGVEIAETAPTITDLYGSDELVAWLSQLVGLGLTLADDPVECHVLNHLHKGGDTHGLHTDDYPVALVMFLESPSCEEGCGHLEFFAACSAGHQSSVVRHDAGDAYLLRADKLSHRVQPIHDGCVRTVLNFAYGATDHVVERTESASILYS